MPSQEIVGAPRTMTLAAWGELAEDEPGELVDGRLVEEEQVDALWAEADRLQAEP